MDVLTISEEYRQTQIELHKRADYGVASLHYAPRVRELIDRIGAKSLCDYGAGKRRLWDTIPRFKIEYFPYDPAFPEYGPPIQADLVCCIDVLEHVEPELLDNVIRQLHWLTRFYGFFSIASGPALKFLADGRNAHLIQQPVSWWREKLSSHFQVERFEFDTLANFYLIVTPK